MKLHEYQAKQLFHRYQLPVLSGRAVSTPEEARVAVNDLKANHWVCKVQVHAGGRGKAGGVKLFSDISEMDTFISDWRSTTFRSYQTDSEGLPVQLFYIEPTIGIKKELYFSWLLDRSEQKIVCIVSDSGGMDIESVADEMIHRVWVDISIGAQPFQGRNLAFALGLTGHLVNQFVSIFIQSYQLYANFDCDLLEINPLVITEENQLLCLDAKISVDGNATYRQDSVQEIFDTRQVNSLELRAHDFGLNYVALDGNIGCVVNGAGLAMATMDLVKLCGGKPANFLDVGGGTTEKSVAEAFKIITSQPDVSVILVNIFGGIVSCEVIAKGIVNALSSVEVAYPLVIRFEGNHSEEGLSFLKESGMNIFPYKDLLQAVTKAVELSENLL